MSLSIQVETREFNAALKQYVALTSKTLAQSLNHKAGNIAFRAYSATPKANKGKLAAELGASYTEKTTRKGKLRKTLQLKSLSAARAILVHRLKKSGKLAGSNIDEARVRKFVGATLRSVGFYRSGWIPAIKRLARGAFFEKKSGRPLGSVRPASEGFRPVVEIENNATPKENRSVVESFMVDALRKAFADETADIEQYLTKKLQTDADKLKPKP